MVYSALISPSRFTYYANQFTEASRAGLESARSIFASIALVDNVNISTFGVLTDAVVAMNSLSVALRSSYEFIFTNQYSTQPMESTFLGLSNHILKMSNLSINEYVSNNDLKVSSTYAKLSRIYGNVIDNSNIDLDL